MCRDLDGCNHIVFCVWCWVALLCLYICNEIVCTGAGCLYVFRGELLVLSLFLVVGMSNLEVVVFVGMCYIFLWMG